MKIGMATAHAATMATKVSGGNRFHPTRRALRSALDWLELATPEGDTTGSAESSEVCWLFKVVFYRGRVPDRWKTLADASFRD